ncbi:AraC family transcriptional regulator [Streptomyces sp. NPDC046203]|uniref:AraC family transcriptional regulator n=1 Tax=Streptomyces sp. NPDC046203 TaxID=3154602 RepID=UPI0033E535D2
METVGTKSPGHRAAGGVANRTAGRTGTAYDDLLSELLTPLRLTGVLDSRWRARTPWAIEGEALRDRAALYYVVDGDCWLTGTGGPPLHLGTGDLALLPTGAAHRLTDHPGSRAEPVMALRSGRGTGQGPGPGQGQGQGPGSGAEALRLPGPRVPGAPVGAREAGRRQERTPLEPGGSGTSGEPDRSGTPAEIRVGGDGPETRLLCAGLPYDAGTITDLYRSLPDVLVLDRSRVEREPLLHDTLNLLARAGRPAGPGDRIVTLRAFEMAFVLALRPLLLDLAEDPERPYSPPLLRHPGIRRALVLIATRFAEPWTIDMLAREAGMSRSAFTAAFSGHVGMSPARHLTECRMREAARLLTETSLPQSAIPARVGYQSAVGFHLAFRKWYGETPGVYRTAVGAGSGAGTGSGAGSGAGADARRDAGAGAGKAVQRGAALGD